MTQSFLAAWLQQQPCGQRMCPNMSAQWPCGEKAEGHNTAPCCISSRLDLCMEMQKRLECFGDQNPPSPSSLRPNTLESCEVLAMECSSTAPFSKGREEKYYHRGSAHHFRTKDPCVGEGLLCWIKVGMWLLGFSPIGSIVRQLRCTHFAEFSCQRYTLLQL
ncbi:hypothetical protein KIL84_014378 [Mauremys mutica]|uniref:Uncharacterized protein n=1 Tax=Mauremys mutica TaxID=74926 RepID=A0A9D4B0Q0_9SAUR|nr:hypothetical protein KIL84_014378 [Mauremys mutica]